jgi:hypothetical protein
MVTLIIAKHIGLDNLCEKYFYLFFRAIFYIGKNIGKNF